jgi:hypothetical protein
VTDYKPIDEYLEKHIDDSIGELSKLAAQPSVGAQNWGMTECASLVSELLKARGSVIQPREHRLLEKKARLTRLAVLQSLDVQPPEPWSFGDSPFEPSLRKKTFRPELVMTRAYLSVVCNRRALAGRPAHKIYH